MGKWAGGCAGLAATVVALVIACASVPDPDRYLQVAAREAETPRVVGPRGPLSAAESRRVLDRLRQEAGDTDLLRRHLAIEEAVADTPLVAGNKALVIEDGPDTFAAMLEDIRAAKRHINAEFFIVDADGFGREFADALIEKRRQGLSVNLIYDAIGSIGTPGAFFDRLREAGIRVLEFHPLNPLKGKNPNDRDHRKILVVDGRVAYTGGINISSVYGLPGGPKESQHGHKGSAAGEVWRDTQIRLEGPVAAEFQKLFLEQWRKEAKEELPDADFFPTVPAAGKAVVRVIATSADKAKPEFLATFISALRNAENSVSITQGYFAPPEEELAALKEAAARGVSVRLVLPQKTDQPKVVFAGRRRYQDLLDAGVEIYERRGVLLHAKTAVVDGVWSVVGSANLDYRSVLYNDEVNAVVLGTEFGEEIEAMFARDLAASDRIDPREWRERPFFGRVKEWFAQFLEPVI
jgi:cardiolipin synthase